MRGLLVAVLVGLIVAAPTSASAHRRAVGTAASYGSWPGETLTLYGPTDKPLPTIVYVHGGGWVRGTINSSETAFAQGLATSLNWPVLAINYPVTAQGDTPQRQVEQAAVNDAVHYAARLASTDPAHIIVWGESAGGNLAILNAERDTTHTHPRVSAVVSISGPTDMRDEWGVANQVMPNNNFVTQYEGETPDQADAAGHTRYADTSPLGQSVAGQPPIFQAVGDSDPITPTHQVEDMDADARSVGAGSVFYEVPNDADHATDLEPDVIPSTGNTVERQAQVFLFTHSVPRS